MAGQPKTRARKAASADKEVPDAGDAGSRARADARPRNRATTWLDVGPQTRTTVDERRAAEVRRFAESLGRESSEVKIERTRPTWCAGFLEYYDVGPDGWRDLSEYIRDEHGGERYRLALVSPNGQELVHCNQPIAGPPRLRGRVIDRQRWDRLVNGGDETPQPPAPAKTEAPQQDTRLFELVLETQREAQKAVLASVEKMVSDSKEATRELVGQVIRPQPGSLAEQLGELRTNVQAVDMIREEIGGDGGDGGDEGPSLEEQREQARQGFLEKVLMKKFMGDGGGEGQRYRRPAPQAAPQPRANGQQPPAAVESD